MSKNDELDPKGLARRNALKAGVAVGAALPASGAHAESGGAGGGSQDELSRQQALHAYTRANAWYLNREKDLGSIEVGKLADLVVLDRDYFSVSDAQARRTRPVLTVVDGKIVYDVGVA